MPMSNTNHPGLLQLDGLDELLEQLDAMDAKITRVRRSLYQTLSNLETEQNQIRRQIVNKIRTLARVVIGKGQMDDDQEEEVMYGPPTQGLNHDHKVGTPRPISNQPLEQPNRKLKRARDGERGDRQTKRPKYNRKLLEHPNPVRRSARLSAKSSPKSNFSPSPNPDAFSSSSVSEDWEPTARGVVESGNSLGPMLISHSVSNAMAAQAQTQGDGTREPANGREDQPATLLHIPIPRPPTDPFPFPGNLLDKDPDLSSYLPELKYEAPDWFILFNPSPKVKRVLDVNLKYTLVHDVGAVGCVHFSQDGKWLATGSVNTAQIYDLETGLKIYVLDHSLVEAQDTEERDLSIHKVCFSPDKKHLATVADGFRGDDQIMVWNIVKQQVEYIFEAHEEFHSLHFSSNGRCIVTSSDRRVYILDMHDGTSKLLAIDDHYEDHAIRSVALSPDEQYLAVGSLYGIVNIVEATTGAVVQRLRGHMDGVFCVAFTPNGKGLMSGSWDKTLKYWDVSGLGIGLNAPRALTTTSSCLLNLTGHDDHVLSTAISCDGTWIVSASDDGNVLFWDARTGVPQCMLFLGHLDHIVRLDLSSTGNLLATMSGDGGVRIWCYEDVG